MACLFSFASAMKKPLYRKHVTLSVTKGLYLTPQVAEINIP